MTNSRAHTAFTGNPNQDCKFGMNCNKRQSGECKRRHLTSNKGKGGGKGGNTSANPGRCAKQGCKEQKSPSGELCKSCFESAKADGGSYQNAHGKRIQDFHSGRNVSYGGAPGSAGVLTWSLPRGVGLEVGNVPFPFGLAYSLTASVPPRISMPVAEVTNHPDRMVTCFWDTLADQRQPLG